MIRLQLWQPLGVFSSSSDELLLLMVNDSNNQSKVVRYSGGEPLFSFTRSYDFPKCIRENKIFFICVADTNSNAVVVVNQSGTFRFRSIERLFQPVGIVTDS